MKVMMAAMALAVALPASAQTAPPTAPGAPAVADPGSVDPARLAAARPVIDQIWPLGTYERIMRLAMDQMVNASMAGMYDMKIDDFAKGMGASDKSLEGKTFRQVMTQEDPYFDERMRRTMKVMMDGMVDMMNEVEPDVRAAFANAYARRFTVAQLNDLHAFFDTPTGRIYAAEFMSLMMGPDMMKAMQSFTPKLMKGMPALMEKVQAATKYLPPPPKRKPTT